MTTLTFNADDRRVRLNRDLTVDILNTGGAVQKSGTWESHVGAEGNQLILLFQGESSTTLRVNFGFNDSNQLLVTIPKQEGVPVASGEWCLPGRVVINDDQDIEYFLVDDSGVITTQKLVVMANLGLENGTDRIRVQFPDGSEAFILGNNGSQSVEASEYVHGGDLARDLLWFDAVTINKIGAEERSYPADIQFVGRWDLYQGKLTLVTRYDTTGTKPKGFIAIGGSYKGTNAGLVVESDGAFAFQIGGSYSWNQSNLTFGLRIGHTPGNGFEGTLDVNGKIRGANGDLTIKGGLTLAKGGNSLAIQLELAVQYTTKFGSLDFSVTASDSRNYQIFFGGTVSIKKGKVTFAVKFNSTNGVKTIEVEFGYYTKDASLKIAVEGILARGGLQLKLNLTFTLAWGPQGAFPEV